MNSQLGGFVSKFAEMREHPDKNIITELTRFAEKNHNTLAADVVQVIVGRLMSQSTHASHKLPIFYLVDSIMKNVGGSYAAMFGQLFITDLAGLGLPHLIERDRKKLEFLFETWRERQFFSASVVGLLKDQLTVVVPQRHHQQQSFSQQQQQSYQQPRHQQQQQPSVNQYGNVSTVPSSGFEGNTAFYNNLVRSDMTSMLNTMYFEMNVTNRLTLDQLFEANLSLWQQLKATAEENVRAKLGNRGQMLATMTGEADRFANNKRGAGEEYSNNGNNDQHYSGGESFDDRPSKQMRTTVDNTMANRYIPPPLQMNNPSGLGSSSGGEDGGSSSALDTSMDSVEMHNHGERTYINGFVGEAPVVVDLERIKAVSGQMADNYQLLAPVMSMDFQEAAVTVVRRLDRYIDNANTPPNLPPMLFGLLPLEPVNKVIKVQAAPEKQEQRVVNRLPMPVFRQDILGRNPENALRALYSDRTLQYHEDGLRFLTPFDLKQHSDWFMVRKLNKLKSAGARESREWYCSCAQWISDFNSLGKEGAEAAAAKASEALSAAKGGAAGGKESPVEEYVVPADEHFTRCPISRERFETTFDPVEGVMLCRNAVKIFVTPPAGAGDSADKAVVYNLGQPTDEEPSVKYCIVHKYVIDRWLEQGLAVSFADAVERYQQTAGGTEVVALLRRAADGEDEDDLFVKL